MQESPHLGEHPAFRIDAHIGAVRLEQLGREPETGFAGAGRADDTGVEVAGVGGIFGPGVHGKKLRLCQNDVVLKLWIDKGLDVFFGAPAGRPVFLIPPKFLCVLAFEVDQQAEPFSVLSSSIILIIEIRLTNIAIQKNIKGNTLPRFLILSLALINSL